MKFNIYQASETGNRIKNEDRLGYVYSRESAFFVLADGMGGHIDGEIAAQVAVETMAGLFSQQAKPELLNPQKFLPQALLVAHEKILQLHPSVNGVNTPCTTVVALILQNGHACWIHCGDSRLYWIRCGQLLQRTRDHSYVERPLPVDHSKGINQSNTKNRNILFSCLGASTGPLYDVSPPHKLQTGDQLLLCSDGLWEHLSDDEIASGLSQRELTTSIPAFMKTALNRSGQLADNLSVMGIEWLSASAQVNNHSVSTKELETGHFSNTLQHQSVTVPALNFTEQDIDNSIAQINDAITRSMNQTSNIEADSRAKIFKPFNLMTQISSTPSKFIESRTQRGQDQLRPVTLQRHYTLHAEGSVLVSFGKTQVLCTASVEERVPPHKRGSGEGWVTAEYGMLPRATHTRSEREAARGKQSGRTQEIQRLIGRSLRAVFDLKKLGERTIHLDCDVLQADGGTRTAAITGAYVAAQDAVTWLLAKNKISQSPLLDHVAAISVGIVKGGALLDLEYTEDSACDTDMNVVMTGAGHYVEVQGTAEGAAFSRDEMNTLLGLAEKGIADLVRLQKQALA